MDAGLDLVAAAADVASPDFVASAGLIAATISVYAFDIESANEPDLEPEDERAFDIAESDTEVLTNTSTGVVVSVVMVCVDGVDFDFEIPPALADLDMVPAPPPPPSPPPYPPPPLPLYPPYSSAGFHASGLQIGGSFL